MANLSDRATGLTNVNVISLNELTDSPATPEQYQKRIYAKRDGKVYTLDSAGNEKEVGSGGGASVEIQAADAEEQFVVGDVLYFNPSNSKYAKAIARSSSSAEVVGVVSEGVGTLGSYTSYIVTTAGYIEGGLSLPGPVDLTAGEVYFLSDSVAGLLTTVEPSIVGSVSRPVLLATAADKGFVLPYRGIVVGGSNARTSLSLNNNASTNIQDMSSYEAGELSGWVSIVNNTPASSLRFYIEAQVSQNGAEDDYNISYQTSGDTPPVGFDMAVSSAGMVSVVLPDVSGFSSAKINYSLNAAAIGVDLPLSIDASNIQTGTFDSARIPDLDAGKIVSGSIDEARLPDSVNGSRQVAASGTVSSTSNTSASNFARITIPKTDYGESGGMFIISLATADQHYSAMGIFNRRSNSSSIVARIQTATGSGTFMGSVTLTISGNELRFNYVGSPSNSGGPRGTILVQSIDPNVSVAF